MTIEEIKAFIEGLGKGYTVEIVQSGNERLEALRKTICIRDGLKEMTYTFATYSIKDAHPDVLKNHILKHILSKFAELV